nr:HEPN domain-containing protein [Candidatus Njordarchaeum guaymaensis]
MSLEELLRSRAISRIKPNHNLALGAIRRAKRDVDTARTLIENEKFDWSLAVAYNAMLQAGRALMFEKGYRPSSSEGHAAVVKFLHAAFGTEVSDRMIMVMNGMRKKRHRIVYEEMDVVSKDEAEHAVKWAEEFVGMIDEAIRQAKEKE